MPLLTEALPSLEAYVAFFASQPLPVLRHTAKALDGLRDDEERINGKQVAGVILADPLMTLRLLTHLEANRRSSQNHDITTIDRAVMMMGIAPFLRAFADLPTVESTLAAHPKALLGALKVIGRSRRAAHIARDWAIVRHDLDVDEITVATLLREATEIICWVFAPALTQRVYDLQRADRTLRSAIAQRQVFGFTAQEIQQALVEAWRLPRLLMDLMDDRHAANPRVRNVVIATNLARHAAHGWDNAALPDDFRDAQALLHIGLRPLLQRLGVPAEFAETYLAGEEDT